MLLWSRPTCPSVRATLSTSLTSMSLPVFIDSGSDANFVDLGFFRKHSILSKACSQPLQMFSFNNQLLNRMTHQTCPVTLATENHVEVVEFLEVPTPQHPLVLGISWLYKHNHLIDWSSDRMVCTMLW